MKKYIVIIIVQVMILGFLFYACTALERQTESQKAPDNEFGIGTDEGITLPEDEITDEETQPVETTEDTTEPIPTETEETIETTTPEKEPTEATATTTQATEPEETESNVGNGAIELPGDELE